MSFEEQIMSKDKYSSIFLKSNGGYCVYYPSNIFQLQHAWFPKLGMFLNIRSRNAFTRIARERKI